MDSKQKKNMLDAGYDALELSIRKWEDIVYGEEYETYDDSNCALCELHRWPLPPKKECDGCIIKQKTNSSLCFGTPFYDFQMAYFDGDMAMCDEYARKMLSFLESLRGRKT